MPAYELSVLLKALPRQDLSAALKRIGTVLLDKGVILQKLDNRGTRDLPFIILKESQRYARGSYFVYTFSGSPKVFTDVDEVCKRDVDILRHGFVDVYKDLSFDCTLEEELLPPALRPSVKKLLDGSNKVKRNSKPMRRPDKELNYFDIYM